MLVIIIRNKSAIRQEKTFQQKRPCRLHLINAPAVSKNGYTTAPPIKHPPHQATSCPPRHHSQFHCPPPIPFIHPASSSSTHVALHLRIRPAPRKAPHTRLGRNTDSQTLAPLPPGLQPGDQLPPEPHPLTLALPVSFVVNTGTRAPLTLPLAGGGVRTPAASARRRFRVRVAALAAEMRQRQRVFVVAPVAGDQQLGEGLARLRVADHERRRGHGGREGVRGDEARRE